jgi:hypothetical protein
MAEERARMMRRSALAVVLLLLGVAAVGAPAAPAASCLNTMPVADVAPGMAAHG